VIEDRLFARRLEVRRILLLFTFGALLAGLMTGLTATAASAQEIGDRVTATGGIYPPGPIAPAPETPQYPLDTQGSSSDYLLVEGEGIDLDSYVSKDFYGWYVPNRVSVEGEIVKTPEFSSPIVRVDSISFAGGNGDGEQGQDIYGTAGSDYLTDTAGDDNVYGLGSGDTISAGRGRDTLYGGTGWDYLVGGYGNDTLYGWTGSDWLDGGAGSDLVYGWSGDDLVDGGTGNDAVYGGAGNDAVYGYKGYDDLYGGTGSDFMHSAGDGPYDLVIGGPGYDVCVVDSKDFAYGCEELYRQ
jgi:Ca2+-binding RTX toxin-like protein